MDNEIFYENSQYQRFNASLDEEGKISIGNFSEFRSKILFEMDKIAYQDAFKEFQEIEFQSLKDAVYESYPSLISYNFRLSEKGSGSNDAIRRLLHLKDTWEAIVFVLYAFTLGEVRKKRVNLSSCQLISLNSASGMSTSSKLTMERILTDAIKPKIQIIKAVSQFSRLNNLNLKCEIITEKLLDLLSQLQDVRNDISHHAVPTREQAEHELNTIIPIFKEMLLETRFLENCNILRFNTYSENIQCEIYNGHHLNKEFHNILISSVETITYLISLGTNQLFVEWNDEYFSISPFMHYLNDSTGHESFLCFYKKKQRDIFLFEPLKIRSEQSFIHLQKRFNQEKDSLLELLSL